MVPLVTAAVLALGCTHATQPRPEAAVPNATSGAPSSGRVDGVPRSTSRYFDVREYGAKGDGRTIDSDEVAGRWLVAIDFGPMVEIKREQFRYAPR